MNPELSFGIVADCQYADVDDYEGVARDSGVRYFNNYRQSLDKLSEAVTTFNSHDLEFIVHLGDFVDRDLNDADRLHKIMGNASAPLWHVLGNHEFWNKDSVATVLEKYNMKSSYYSRVANGNRFIILDTCDLGPLEHPEGSVGWKMGQLLIEKMRLEGAINAYFWNGGLGERQMEWLNNELTTAERYDEKAILFAHHPVFPPGVLNALNDNEIMKTIDSHDNVTAFINGHNHAGAFGSRNGVPYVTMPGMLSGPTNAYGIAHVYNDRLEIKGYGRVMDMVLKASN